MLYHVSEEPSIACFEPRETSTGQPVVWGVHPDRLRNYLLPRDCPRVTYFAAGDTTSEDVDRFLGASTAVVAFESDWLDRVRQARLYVYEFSEAGFACVDDTAGYFQSESAVRPHRVEVVDDCLGALANQGVEVRFVHSLWPLHDAVVASTLGYSIIRMRNAQPKIAG
ncbi:MAG: DUF6886 family protein [Planctomycetota bacterium]